MKFHVITLFPEVIDAYAGASILGRAQKEKLLSVKSYQLRDFVRNKWGKADGRPYGGGPGMVLQAEPIISAAESILKMRVSKRDKKISNQSSLIYQTKYKKPRIIITSAAGKPLTNAYAKKITHEREVVIICGRYEGIDSRVKKVLTAGGATVDEISIGPYILTGGEVPALAIIDAAARQIPGILGKSESLEESRIASYEMYTRPEVLTQSGRSYRVPKVLLSGHRAHIDIWKQKKRSNPK